MSQANQTFPAPAAGAELGKKISLSLETKRLIGEVEREVDALDWNVSDPLRMVPQLELPAVHLLTAGGKRIRPLLVCLLGRALNVPKEKLAPCAIAAELVHTATLLHDDILDGATTRRGRITAHLKYNAHTAILSGDALLAKAISDMASLGDTLVLQRLADTVRELVEGECLQADLMGRVHGEVDSVLEVARRKTASLFAWCAWVAGHRAGSPLSQSLYLFGNHLGLAFQILDDILDWESEDTGKPRFKDLQEAKLNVVGAWLVSKSDQAHKICTEFFSSVDAHGELTVNDSKRLGQLLTALPEYANARAWAKAEADKHSTFALSHLRELSPSPWRDLVEKLTQQLLERMR
jgi:octaprenyl-diphosphate synthase